MKPKPLRDIEQTLWLMFEEKRDVGFPPGEITTALGVSSLIASAVVSEDSLPAGPVAILDFAAGTGSTLVATGERVLSLGGTLDRLNAIDVSSEAAAFAEELGSRARMPIAVAVADSLADDPFPDTTYDLVVSVPPFALRWKRDAAAIDEDPGLLSPLPPATDATFVFVQRALAKLRKPEDGGGRAAIITSLPPLFGRSEGEECVRRWLLDTGLLESITYLPGGVHAGTTIPTALLVFSNLRKPGPLRVVNATPLFDSDEPDRHKPRRVITDGHFGRIIENLHSSKDSSHSASIERQQFEFTDWKVSKPGREGPEATAGITRTADESEASLLALFNSHGLTAAPKQTRTSLAIPTRVDPKMRAHQGRLRKTSASYLLDLVLHSPTDEVPTCGHDWLWFPSTANSQVKVGEQSTKHGHAICVDPELAMPEFICSIMNAPIGREERMSRAGAVIPNIPKSVLLSVRVPLVEPTTQRVAVSVSARIQAQQQALAGLADSLWAKPSHAQAVEARFDEMVPQDSHEQWLDVLPFPLSSALWRAIATIQPKERHDQLLDFFEATAAYCATFHLSAQLQPRVDSPNETEALLNSLRDDHAINLSYAEFGNWIRINSALAANARRTAESTGEESEPARAQLVEGYGTDPSFLRRVTSRDLTAIFESAADLRNNHAAHSGRVTDAEATRWLEELDDLLLRLRAALGSSFATHPLVRPTSSLQRSGRWMHTVETLTGSKLPFRTSQVELDHPLDADDLYVLHPDADVAVRMIRFIRLVAPSDVGATDCFFYSRRADNQLKYVSYNAVRESEAFMTVDIPILDALSD